MLSAGIFTAFPQLLRRVAYIEREGCGPRLAQVRKTGSWTGAQLSTSGLAMRLKKEGGKKPGKVVAKEHLPSKICVVCNRPFTWRKKWESCWKDVKYCSERCRRSRNTKPADVSLGGNDHRVQVDDSHREINSAGDVD